MRPEFESTIEFICQTDQRYKKDAYAFMMEALTFTQRKYNRPRHVSAQQLLEGIKSLSLRQFGPLALTVFEHWGIKSTEDFGNIVFNLVDSRILGRSEEDDIAHFRNGYDFEEVFSKGYRSLLHKRISRMRSA